MWVPRVFTVGAPDFSTLADAVDRALREEHTGELEGIQRGPGTVTVLA